jgi:hypothetical protein
MGKDKIVSSSKRGYSYMANEKMSKKLRQAVDYANATDTTKGVGNPPNTSKKAKDGFMQPK